MTGGAAKGPGGPLRVFLVDDHAIVRSGVRGYLLKDADAGQVAAAIRAAAAGQCHLDPAVARILADSLRARPPTA
jgi:hypothetical protein